MGTDDVSLRFLGSLFQNVVPDKEIVFPTIYLANKSVILALFGSCCYQVSVRAYGLKRSTIYI